MDKVKAALTELGLEAIKIVQVLVVYIIPSALVALLESQELESLIQGKLGERLVSADVVVVMAAVNVFIFAIAKLLKRFIPDNIVAKAL